MANNTTEYWSIDNTSLHQYGWSVATIGGSRYDLPPLRGENITLAYTPGQIHRPKLADQRVINLIMWVTGMDPAAGTSTGDQVLRWNDSWDFLRRLVWKPAGAQVTLTRRTRLTLSGTPGVLAVDGAAAVSDAMAPTMTGRTRADFTMTLTMADPYFYGSAVTATLELGVVTSVVNPGSDSASHNHLTVDLVGPLTNPIVGNGTTSPVTTVKYTGSIATGVTVRLDVGNYTATRLSDGANVIGAISNTGSRRWVTVLPGTNLINLTAASGSGHAVVTFNPPYV